jgi:hypothetical protein
MKKHKMLLSLACHLALFLVWHHYDPIGADVLGVVLAIILVGMVFHVYFAPIKSKRKSIAKFKAKHNIPLDQPHKVDEILKEGFFRAN